MIIVSAIVLIVAITALWVTCQIRIVHIMAGVAILGFIWAAHRIHIVHIMAGVAILGLAWAAWRIHRELLSTVREAEQDLRKKRGAP